MNVILLNEAGYTEATYGISLSYNSTTLRAKEIAPKLAFGESGEGKFLESIHLWVEVLAPRFFWQEGDTYRISTKQSESTMHTLTRKPLTQDNFYKPIFKSTLEELNSLIAKYKECTDRDAKYELFIEIKDNLPEGFEQKRVWNFNYSVLQNMYNQRHKHRLKLWHSFLNTLLSSIQHPEFIVKEL